MTNKKLRKALLAKLNNISPQALSQRVQRIKKQVACTTEEATYVIAQREGVVLDRYLDHETIAKIRDLMSRLSIAATPTTQRTVAAKRASPSAVGRPVVQIGKEIKIDDPLLPARKISEAKSMASIYPLLYVLENSIREFIDRVMTSKWGSNWWDVQAPRTLRNTVAGRMADEEKNRWHQTRGARPIDYLDLNQLPKLMRQIQEEVVPKLIPSLSWFEALIEETYKCRCVLCHMNPLDDDNINAVKLRLRHWEKQIKAKKDSIPSASS